MEKLSVVYKPCATGGFIAYIEEMPGVNTQGKTLEEARENINEAVRLHASFNEEAAHLMVKRNPTVVMSDFVSYLTQQGCRRLYHDKHHELYVHATDKTAYVSTVPKLKEIDCVLADKICRDLNVSIIF